MTAFTAAQSGDWNNPDTWTQSGWPGDGVDAGGDTGDAGNYTVTITDDLTIGTGDSTEAVKAISSGASGTLIIDVDVNITLDGNMGCSNDITIGAGVTITPLLNDSGDLFRINFTGYQGDLTINGTSENHVTIGPPSVATGNWYITIQKSNTNISYLDYLNYRQEYVLWGNVYMDHVHFGVMESPLSYEAVSTYDFDCSYLTLYRDLAGLDVAFALGGANPDTTELRQITHSVIVGYINWSEFRMDLDNCVFQGSFNNAKGSTHQNCLILHPGGAHLYQSGILRDSISIHLYPDNPHFLSINGNADSANASVLDMVFEHWGSFTSDNGEYAIASNLGTSAGAFFGTFDGILGLPDDLGRYSAMSVAWLGGTTGDTGPRGTWISRHVTSIDSIGHIGENYAGHAGMLVEYTSSICYAVGDSQGQSRRGLVDFAGGGSATNVITDGGWNVEHGTDGDWEADVEDIVENERGPIYDFDPNFVGGTTNLIKVHNYGETMMGLTGTRAEIRDQMKAIFFAYADSDDLDHDPDFDIATMIHWIKEQYRPRHCMCIGTGFEGTHIGAVEPVAEMVVRRVQQ